MEAELSTLALGLVLMDETANFLAGLPAVATKMLAGRAAVRQSVDGVYREVVFEPVSRSACSLVVHSEEDTEITVEFGAFSTAHFYSSNAADNVVSAEMLIEDLVNGKVIETVWYRRGAPCRALARVGNGQAALTFRTRRGLCLHSHKETITYVPYGEGLRFSLRDNPPKPSASQT